MSLVKGIVAHILDHVLAEASSVDESQTDGVQDRADYVLDAIDIFVDDNRDIETNTFLKELAQSGKGGPLRGAWGRMLKNAEDDPRPRLLIQAWVNDESEERGG